MKIKTFLRNALLPVLMVCSPAWAQMTTGKIHMEERHGAWSSFILEFPSLITYRATASGNDPSVLLTLDVFSDTCNSNLSFIFPFGAPLEENRDSVGVQIDARVDSGKMFYLAGSFRGVMGDSHGQITLSYTQEYTDLINAMKAGRTARFRVTDASSEHLATISFSLIGFTHSFNRLAVACDATKEALQEFDPPIPAQPRGPLKDAFFRTM